MLGEEISRRRADRDGRRPEIILGIDNYAGLVANLEGPAETEVRSLVIRLFSGGPGVGITVAATAKQPGDIPHRISALAPAKLAFRLTDRFEYKGLGIESPPDLATPGRAVFSLTQLEVQVAVPHRDGIATAVEAIGAEVGVGGPVSIGVLPDEVKIPDIVDAARLLDLEWVIPIGLGDRDLKPSSLVLRPGDHALIAGPARSGRTTALATIATVVRNTRDDVEVLAIVGDRSNLADRPAIDFCFANAVEAIATIERGRSTLLLIDDAEFVDDDGTLAGLIARREDDVHVIAAGTSDVLRSSYGHWTQEVCRLRTGILLRPNGQADGDLLHTTLPRSGPDRWVPGRGYLIQDGAVELVQLAGSW